MQIPTGKKIKVPKKRKVSLFLEILIWVFIFTVLIYLVIWGKDFLKDAKFHKLKSDIFIFKNLINSYKNSYGFLPGDDPLAVQKCKNMKFVKNGNASELVGDNKAVDEVEQAIRHLRCRNLLDGNPNEYPLIFPQNPYGGIYYLTFRKFNGKSFNVIAITKLPINIAIKYDKSLDDGSPTSGKIRFSIEKDKGKNEVILYQLLTLNPKSH